MQTKVYSSLNSQLLADWLSLWESSSRAHFFNSPLWYQACLLAFHYSHSGLIAVYDHDRLVGLLPLVKSKKFGISVFISPGEPFLDRSSLLLADLAPAEILSEISVQIFKLGSVYLSEVDSSLWQLLRSSNPRFISARGSSSPYLLLADDPLRYLSGKNNRRLQKSVSAQSGRFHLKSLPDHQPDVLKIIQEIETTSNKIHDFKSVFTDPQFLRLYSALDKLGQNFSLTQILYLDSDPICYWYGFLAKGIYSGCSTAYKTAYAGLYPGKTLIYLYLSHLSRAGVEVCDFSRGLSRYKTDFTPFIRQHYSVFYSPQPIFLLYWQFINLVFNWLESRPVLFEFTRRIKRHLC